jgi:hypothetical protein
MPIVGGLDIHRKQITFDYLDTETGQVQRGQVSPADRAHLRAWLARFNGRDDVAFAVEGCAGWRYVTEELAAAGVAAHLAEPADTAAEGTLRTGQGGGRAAGGRGRPSVPGRAAAGRHRAGGDRGPGNPASPAAAPAAGRRPAPDRCEGAVWPTSATLPRR